MLLQVLILGIVYGVGNYFLVGVLLQGFLLAVSIVGLYYGAELALDASEKIGKYIGLSPLIIGL